MLICLYTLFAFQITYFALITIYITNYWPLTLFTYSFNIYFIFLKQFFIHLLIIQINGFLWMTNSRYFFTRLIVFNYFPTFNTSFISLRLIDRTLINKIVYFKRNIINALNLSILNRNSIYFYVFLLNIFCIIFNVEFRLRFIFFLKLLSFFLRELLYRSFNYIDFNRLFVAYWT